ncbi:MAG: SDR family oxidoreductase [Kofleriaceae bacterium]|nr:SDR family oxidoreductase [Kofleriaceae bacterium]
MSNTSMHQQIVLITGATAGIGRTTALYLAKLGRHVIATGRKPAELAKLRLEAAGTKLDTVELDVTSVLSITRAAADVQRLTNGYGIDVLVNNAGYGALGPSSEITDAEMRRQYDTNVFGVMNVIRAFLPAMQARRSGRIINVSSLGGRVTLPYFGIYNSTKYAVESLSDALRYELHAFGIYVTLIEPGVIRTNFETTALADLSKFDGSPYAVSLKKVDALSKRMNRFAGEPIVIARAIARAATVRRPAARYVAPRLNNVVLALKTVLPTRIFDWSMRKVGYLTKTDLALDRAAAAAAAATAKVSLRAVS